VLLQSFDVPLLLGTLEFEDLVLDGILDHLVGGALLSVGEFAGEGEIAGLLDALANQLDLLRLEESHLDHELLFNPLRQSRLELHVDLDALHRAQAALDREDLKDVWP